MNEEYKIENVGPPPEKTLVKKQSAAEKNSKKYPFDKLEERQSFFLESTDAKDFARVRSAASYYGKMLQRRLRCYVLEDGRLQVYRDKDDAPASNAGRKPGQAFAPPKPCIEGPTQEQWKAMLWAMKIDALPVVIPSDYVSCFPTMIEWSNKYSTLNKRTYSCIQIGQTLSVQRGQDVKEPIKEIIVEDSFDDSYVDPDLLEDMNPDYHGNVAVSLNNDGWTTNDCPQCQGAGCMYCSNTGHQYIAELDLRAKPVLSATDAANLHNFIESNQFEKVHKKGKDDKEPNYS